MRQLQIKDGRAQSEWRGSGGMPVPPDSSWTFIDVTDRPDAQVGMTYDADTDAFTPPPPVSKTCVSKSQVVSVLTPQEWATANSSTEPEVVWGMAQFQLADVIDLADPRFASILGGLIAKGIVTQARAADITSDLQALANA